MTFETIRWPAGTLQALQQIVGQIVLPGANLGTSAEIFARINAGELLPPPEEMPCEGEPYDKP